MTFNYNNNIINNISNAVIILKDFNNFLTIIQVNLTFYKCPTIYDRVCILRVYKIL